MENDQASASSSSLLWGAAPAHLASSVGEIHVFAFALTLSESQVERSLQLLSHDELARAERFKFARDRERYVVGRARLRMILGHYANSEPKNIRFCYSKYGKPALPCERDPDRIRFNLSRSHGLGVLAIQVGQDLGIDIEHLRPFPNALPIAERLFAAEEHRLLRSLPAAEVDAAFFHYWTRKEAVVKSIGRGLSLPIDHFTLSSDPGTVAEKLVVEGENGPAHLWSLPVPAPSQEYVVALATTGFPHPVKCWTWTDE